MVTRVGVGRDEAEDIGAEEEVSMVHSKAAGVVVAVVAVAVFAFAVLFLAEKVW